MQYTVVEIYSLAKAIKMGFDENGSQIYGNQAAKKKHKMMQKLCVDLLMKEYC